MFYISGSKGQQPCYLYHHSDMKFTLTVINLHPLVWRTTHADKQRDEKFKKCTYCHRRVCLTCLSVCRKFTAADFVRLPRVEELTAFVIEVTVFSGRTQCQLAVCYQRFGGTCILVIFEVIGRGRLIPLSNVGNVLPVNTVSDHGRFFIFFVHLMYSVLSLKKSSTV